ncbi:MAG: NADH-quinone oxidoreductase subunit NuoK [Planctomycetes bacterium]|nr:NADH-quinone oxidoreductase subunit NuoK [Planctomycetota bacterium]
MTHLLASTQFGASHAVTVTLALSALLFVTGLVGFLVRRNMILMFLSTEIMFQAAALAFIAFGRMRMDTGGQIFVIFILTVAAAEAALALGLVVLLFRRKETLNSEAWSELHE